MTNHLDAGTPVSTVPVRSFEPDPHLAQLVAVAMAAKDDDWRVFRGPYPPGSKTAAVMASRGNLGKSYRAVVADRPVEFRSWTDPDTSLRYVLIRRRPGEAPVALEDAPFPV